METLKKLRGTVLLPMIAMVLLNANAAPLVINTDTSDQAVKAAFDAAVNDFKIENPDVQVKVNRFDHDAYKTAIRNFLTADSPDVVNWYPGHKMEPFVRAGLFEDVSDIWTKYNLDTKLKSASSAMTLNGKKWGIPYTYYQWGIYYRKDIFSKFGIEPPNTWQELLDACAKLKANGVAPFVIGTKEPWPNLAWFDYLNLRVNGFAFHMALTGGKVSFKDPRVRAVFDRWDQLTKPGYFMTNHASYTWQEAAALLAKGKGAMYLMGNFVVAPMKQAGLDAEKLGFMPFPIIDPSIPRAEEAPIESIHIPTNAKNKADARRFLAYMARADVQAKYGERTEELPVNQDAPPPSDPYLKAGAALLAKAQALSQFFDRDASPELTQAAMDAFERYMLKPDTRAAALDRLEQVRQRVYNK
ncbi:ABC transporter substrate-binding protein [Burkholderia pseudomallei]|uniref:ABC transporter substrate-binding protein n=1 Tax=Burkholderia pseudomallei TaxID=28450 RepID=UPI00050DF8A5|nr:extracellular solute-binding protein [Burkholderia pseudomallei]KGD03119.1 bacterial extracellular solute-binding family protein [Burkholderia pseudomallei]KGT01239.1 bacterial extracellular solute-binding family protein [Burkholderia pseudomallei]KGW04705.1 bacterial extracellular solute-binding family protein [Burkholderia pseudomallei MSHR4000]ONC47578.1 sugar ABC transporter substrate-binding protein [Burkholderia pseudomallei]